MSSLLITLSSNAALPSSRAIPRSHCPPSALTLAPSTRQEVPGLPVMETAQVVTAPEEAPGAPKSTR
jgi:hypothetical protein